MTITRRKREPPPYLCVRLMEELWHLQCRPRKTAEHWARIGEIERWLSSG
jgi:hypothetical protein